MDKKRIWGFLGGSAVKTLPATAGDTGSIPDPGRSHMLRSNYASCHNCEEPRNQNY